MEIETLAISRFVINLSDEEFVVFVELEIFLAVSSDNVISVFLLLDFLLRCIGILFIV